ncbi:MAG: stage II sporulation protein P [Oscillospiraceae bacterium]|nr:stage II sporulation protein P [Oscillospiraceae bacterium]
MDRNWSALWAAALSAAVLSALPAPAETAEAVRPLLEKLSELTVTWELGAPRQGARLLTLLGALGRGGTGSDGELPAMAPFFRPAGETPSPAPEEAAAEEDALFAPEIGEAPAPDPAESLTPEPAESPTPEPAESPTPEPAESPAQETGEPTPAGPEASGGPEIRTFTDAPGVRLKNNAGVTVDINALASEELSLRLPAEGPQVLILHTHGTEAYQSAPGEEYEATDPYRTTDADHSVIRVGDVLAAALEECGLRVLHDRELYDYPSYAGSYSRSAGAAERWLAQYPDIAVIIDVHRDAVGSQQVIYKTLAQTTGESAAQVMLVIGTGENGLPHPRWRENLKLALAMQSAMDDTLPTLSRPIQLSRERYNQHLVPGAFLLGVGTNANTLSEACRAAELFGRTVGPLLVSLAED